MDKDKLKKITLHPPIFSSIENVERLRMEAKVCELPGSRYYGNKEIPKWLREDADILENQLLIWSN